MDSKFCHFKKFNYIEPIAKGSLTYIFVNCMIKVKEWSQLLSVIRKMFGTIGTLAAL